MWKKRKNVTQKRNSGAGGGRRVVDQAACNRNHTCGTQLSTPPEVKCKYSKIPIII
jgi:hypothetical protein